MNLNKSEAHFFLAIPLPSLRLAYRLSLMDDLFSDAECDYGNSSFPHLTVLAPRLLASDACLVSIKEIVERTRPNPLRLEELTFFEPGRVVAQVAASWLSELHSRILSLSALPAGDPSWEGTAYAPHVSIAKAQSPAAIPAVGALLGLPFEWLPTRLDLFVKPAGEKYYLESDYYVFSE